MVLVPKPGREQADYMHPRATAITCEVENLGIRTVLDG